ncbi:MAG: anaerobic benzoate catabolism transcriptional regulator [Pelotomaculum sp. PtaB.Bin104]|nr:MAG: anaerobic benzoate catabolism transcriptional regulator [Pelotomaculum sp. PtaB.Bin104]
MCATRIKEIRLAKGINQVTLAKMLGISQVDVSRKENGVTRVTVDDLRAFAKALEVPVSALLDEASQSTGTAG